MNTLKHRNDFGQLLDELNLNGFGIEIGVAHGNFSEILLNNTKLKKIYFLDPWKEYPKEVYQDCTNNGQKVQDGRYALVVEKLKKYGERASIIRKDSVDGLLNFPDNYFDFIYIDANHSYEYVKRDMSNWYPKLKIGGVFSGHDYMDGILKTGTYRVKTAVDEFCKTINKIPRITGFTRRCPPSWYLTKE